MGARGQRRSPEFTRRPSCVDQPAGRNCEEITRRQHELRYEQIKLVVSVALKGALRWEIHRVRDTGDVGVPKAIHRDAEAVIAEATAEVG
jgi:hypothetical protein